jgi:hypothetical protein
MPQFCTILKQTSLRKLHDEKLLEKIEDQHITKYNVFSQCIPDLFPLTSLTRLTLPVAEALVDSVPNLFLSKHLKWCWCWSSMLCGLAGRYQRFGQTNCLHHQDWTEDRQYIPLKCWYSYKSTWRYNPEDQHWHLHCCKNLKSHIWNDLMIKWEWKDTC